MVHRKIRALTLLILAIVFLPTFIYIIGLSSNSFFVPPEKQNEIPMRFGVYLGEIRYNETADLNIGVWLRFTGTLVAGKEVVIDAVAYANSTLAINTVDIVDIFFRLSMASPITNDTNGLPHENRLELVHIMTTSLFISATPIHIVWPNPGDYAPTVDVVFYDHSETEANIPLVAVHVEPASEVQTENFNRINTGLTYALVAFGIIEIAVSGSEYLEGYLEVKRQEGPREPNHRSETDLQQGPRPTNTRFE